MPEIKIEVTDRKGQVAVFAASSGTTLMHAMKDHGLPVAAICSGAKSCATCHIFVSEGYTRVGTPDEDEIDLLAESDHYQEDMSRLSCQIELSAEMENLKVQLAPES
jgi:2Fe-2S ferredoxin